SIVAATEELVREVMERNGLAAGDMVSCIFTATDDLDAEFPAVAARRLGLDQVPLLCSREIPVPGALPRVIRLLPHYRADEAHEVHDVVEGDGYAVAHIDAMGDDYGFRKIRRAVGVTEFGVNAVVTPPGFGGGGHYHDEQQELYMIHRGKVEFEFGDGGRYVL